jgi:hypothetical protein
VLCFIVVPLPAGEKLAAVQLNINTTNNNNNNLVGKSRNV